MILPKDSAERVEAAVAAAEEHSSVELVVVSSPASGSYRDAEYLFGLACGVAFLGVALFSDHVVAPEWVIPEFFLAWLLGWGACRWTPPLRRLLVPRERRLRQARHAAELHFLAQGVDATRGRTGILVYLSFFERRVSLVADRGVRSEFDRDELDAFRTRLDAALRGTKPVEAFCAALVEIGKELGERLPRDEDDEDELQNAPLLDVAL